MANIQFRFHEYLHLKNILDTCYHELASIEDNINRITFRIKLRVVQNRLHLHKTFIPKTPLTVHFYQYKPISSNGSDLAYDVTTNIQNSISTRPPVWTPLRDFIVSFSRPHTEALRTNLHKKSTK